MTTSPADRRVPLGRAPRPATGPDLAERVRRLLLDRTPDDVRGADRVVVEATTDGTDVPHLSVDGTGVVVPVTDSGRAAGGQGSGGPAPADAGVQPALLGELDVVGHPLEVAGVPVDVDLAARGVRFLWIEDVEGGLWAEVQEPDDAAPVSGHVRVAAGREALVDAVRTVAAENAGRIGVTLSSLDVAVEQRGPRGIGVEAVGRVRKGFVSAPVTVRATASVDDAMVLTVGDLAVSSGNPVVSALLGTVRGRVEAYSGRRFDLAGSLPPGLQLADVRVDVGEQIVLQARLA
ncbi:hypothetical protein [Cellulomonas sp. PhB143]|uniref:hypothetical protein n=1 Tax=Cellulomonas sp. PhB143 TaxID=2485186 RepID=UPI000F4987F7|nr:hypothetical protein [Cellulomonas sp. PhB143]ROS75559.1 hypothetical protein EDF32_1971 [Cellulomonas sp. PhB143]